MTLRWAARTPCGRKVVAKSGGHARSCPSAWPFKWGVGWSRAGQMPLSRGFDSFFATCTTPATFPPARSTTPTSRSRRAGLREARHGGHRGPVARRGPRGRADGVARAARSCSCARSTRRTRRCGRSRASSACTRRCWTSPGAAKTAYVDQAVGEIKAALEAKGMLERTLLVVTSDLGEPTYPGARARPSSGRRATRSSARARRRTGRAATARRRWRRAGWAAARGAVRGAGRVQTHRGRYATFLRAGRRRPVRRARSPRGPARGRLHAASAHRRARRARAKRDPHLARHADPGPKVIVPFD
jgi:hypothetical protein